MKYGDLRKKYPKFIYEEYDYKIKKGNLEISFLFKIQTTGFSSQQSGSPRTAHYGARTVGNCPAIKETDIQFKPKIIIKNIPTRRPIPDYLIFHLGLMEIPSYWKTTCSPVIEIKAGDLNKEQIKWWKDLIIKGLGEFFYKNKIDWRIPNFLKIETNQNQLNVKIFDRRFNKNGYLVPIGGGRDSIITLEALKKQKKTINKRLFLNCFLVNPTSVAKKVVKIAGIKKPIIVQRKVDPNLLKLNKEGYLNGHTPFTAVLSFLSVFCAVLFGYKNIVFSNEKSADEGNVKYLDRMINHQYSKSSEFEKKFKNYCKKYLVKNINYFSFLRDWTESEISKMFIKYPRYFSTFSSCNANIKIGTSLKNRWCGKCPKCLFVYMTLYPYLKREELMKIFDQDLFQNKKLLPVMKALIGQGNHKPFECVGTYKESRIALNLSLRKALRQTQGKLFWQAPLEVYKTERKRKANKSLTGQVQGKHLPYLLEKIS